jgi:uncharacterized protein
VIDDNCHPFAAEAEPLDLANMSLDVHEDPGRDRRRHEHGPWRVGQELLAARLCERLGCRREELGTARSAAAADWTAYTRQLFADAGISDLVMDVGYPAGAEALVPQMKAVSGCQVHAIARLESVIDPAIAEGLTAEEIWQRLSNWMEATASAGAAGFKAFIAYRTGLAVEPAVSRERAEASLRTNLPLRRRGKPCRDWLLEQALGAARELGVPMHVHAGLGDSDLRLGEANPLLLEPLLETPQGRAATIVIIHSAYPFHEELAYLATTHPNIWADVSMSNLYAPATFGQRLLAMLDLAPAGKLLLGTDGHDQPEIFWYGASVLRHGWLVAAQCLEASGIRPGWITAVEEQLFGGNARTVYRLAP